MLIKIFYTISKPYFLMKDLLPHHPFSSLGLKCSMKPSMLVVLHSFLKIAGLCSCHSNQSNSGGQYISIHQVPLVVVAIEQNQRVILLNRTRVLMETFKRIQYSDTIIGMLIDWVWYGSHKPKTQ